MLRYLRAIMTAIKLTIEGKQVPYQPLLEWIDTGHQLAETTLKTADAIGFDKTKRQQTLIKIDGREQSMEITLTAVKYHLGQEYPYLLQNMTEHTITAIYASNMNDQHALNQLRELASIDDDTLKAAINQLSDHLNSIPPSNSLTDS